MKIIGITGRGGAGKDTLADYLNTLCAIPTIRISDYVQALAEEQEMPPDRANRLELAERILGEWGLDHFVNQAIQEIEAEEWEVATITGIRLPEEVLVLRNYYRDDFMLISVTVDDSRERYRRVEKWDQDQDPKGYDRFLENDRKEKEIFDLDETISQADLMIPNDERLEDFHYEIRDRIVEDALADEIVCDPGQVQRARERIES